MSRSRATVALRSSGHAPSAGQGNVGHRVGAGTPARSARNILGWVCYIAMSAIYLKPVLATTVVADDFINPFAIFDVVGPGLADLRYTWEAVGGAGHFNYLGHILGIIIHRSWLDIASRTGVQMASIYGLLKLLAFLGAAVAGASYTRLACTVAGRPISVWRSRVFVSVFLFSTLQLHVPWSNDPVGSYPLAGFVPAAIGFSLLTAGLRMTMTPDRSPPWLVGVLGTLAFLYYELNVAAVVAVGVLVLWGVAGQSAWSERWANLKTFLPALMIPFVIAVGLQLQAAPRSANYGGTSIAFAEGSGRAFGVALISSLPTAAWPLSRHYLSGVVELIPAAVITLAVVGSVLAFVSSSHARPTPSARVLRSTGAALTSSPMAYWVLATLVQAATVKVQSEAVQVGQVYTYYAIGATTLAVVGAMLFHLLPHSALVLRLAPGFTVLFSLFVLVQSMINWNISQRFNATTGQYRALLAAYSDQRNEAERCIALHEWAVLKLPDYYEVSMIEGLDAASHYYHGEPFCSDFVRPP